MEAVVNLSEVPKILATGLMEAVVNISEGIKNLVGA